MEVPIHNAFKQLELVQRDVQGSESEKEGILPKFMGLRLWSGCSSLLFTLNPHDIRSPLTLLLVHEDTTVKRRFSLDLSDEEVASYMSDFLREDPRRLQSLVARNPLAATRCFHWTGRLVIRTLFNCADKPGISADGIPAKGVPGVFRHVRA